MEDTPYDLERRTSPLVNRGRDDVGRATHGGTEGGCGVCILLSFFCTTTKVPTGLRFLPFRYPMASLKVNAC